MSYETALNKSWDDLLNLSPHKDIRVKFLADEYEVDLKDRKMMSLSCNVPAKDFTAILILHYLAHKLKGLPGLSGEWLTFRELSGVEGYAGAFRQRSIEPIIRKYGASPEGILANVNKLPMKKAEATDFGVVIDAFEDVPVLVKLWRADAEFAAEANMYFDKSIARIFCTEDIAVLAGIVAHQL